MAEGGVGPQLGQRLGRGVEAGVVRERGDVLAVGDLGVQELVDLDHQRLLAGAVEDHHHALGVRALLEGPGGGDRDERGFVHGGHTAAAPARRASISCRLVA